jgi:hypothetical protein
MNFERIHERLTNLSREHLVPGAQLAIHHETIVRFCELINRAFV